MIKRKQVPIEPGFAITTHKAQGQTMKNMVIDLSGCPGMEQPYVMVSRSTSLDGLMTLRDFDFEKITRRHSEDLRKELARLENLRLQTIARIGSEDEVNEARQFLKADKNDPKKRKRMGDGGYVRTKKSNVGGV